MTMVRANIPVSVSFLVGNFLSGNVRMALSDRDIERIRKEAGIKVVAASINSRRTASREAVVYQDQDAIPDTLSNIKKKYHHPSCSDEAATTFNEVEKLAPIMRVHQSGFVY